MHVPVNTVIQGMLILYFNRMDLSGNIDSKDTVQHGPYKKRCQYLPVQVVELKEARLGCSMLYNNGKQRKRQLMVFSLKMIHMAKS